MSETTTSANPYVLVVTHESGSTTKHPLVPGRSVVLGSSRHCGIQVSGKDVANMHCLIDLNDDVLGVQDWASSSGTIVNGAPIASKTSISENDQVNIGAAVIKVRRSLDSNDLHQDDSAGEQQDVIASSIDREGAACQSTDSQAASEVEADDAVADEYQIETPADQMENVDEPCDAELPADDYDWNTDFDDPDNLPSANGDWDDTDAFDQYDAETVQLLKAEIDDLRSMLADRDSQVEELAQANEFGGQPSNTHPDQSPSLQHRVDELLAEAAENDERFQIVQDLLESAELKNQAESEERLALESWVGEIEYRIGQRESEWKAEIESVRTRLSATEKERNQLQHKLREVASRFGAQDVYRETLEKLQSRNATLQEQLAKTQKQAAASKQQLENIQNRESEAVQQERALIAQERASVSRMRFELSQKLSEFEESAEPRNPADREVGLRIRALRSHLRELHEQERADREQKGESLFTRISSMWKKMDEY